MTQIQFRQLQPFVSKCIHLNAAVFGCAATSFAEETSGVALIYLRANSSTVSLAAWRGKRTEKDERVIFVREIADLLERRNVSVHREHTVCSLMSADSVFSRDAQENCKLRHLLQSCGNLCSRERISSVNASARTSVLGRFELLLQVGHIDVLVAEALGFAQAHTVNDRGVIQFVADDLC